MEYTITIDGGSFTGSVITMLGSAFNGIKDYIIPAFRELVTGEKYSDKWNMAKKFLKEYFKLIIFLKHKLGKKVHPAVNELLKAADFEGEEILNFLDKSKVASIASITRQIRGKFDSSDILDLFLNDVAEVDDDDDWE